MPVNVAVAPTPTEWVIDQIAAAGAVQADPSAAEALVWTEPLSRDLASILAMYPNITWAHLPTAGIEQFADVIDDDHVWTCTKGAHALPIAERAVALLLALLHQIGPSASDREWTPRAYENLYGKHVLVLGAGSIGMHVVELLRPFRPDFVLIRRQAERRHDGLAVLGLTELPEALRRADAVVLTVPLTAQTIRLIGRDEFSVMKPSAVIVNVARGALIDHDALALALDSGALAGAGLDVTDPEPLPKNHRLFGRPNCIVTSHSAAFTPLAVELVQRRLADNLRRFIHGEELLGVVDSAAGY